MSLVEMTDIIGILFFVVLIVKVVVFFRLGVVIGRVKVIVFNFRVVVARTGDRIVVIRGIGGFDV